MTTKDLFIALLKYWGSVGYLYYDDLLKNNNNKKLSDEELNRLFSYFQELRNLDKNSDNYDDEMDWLCEAISKFINEKLMSKIFKNYLKDNKDGYFFIKKTTEIQSIDEVEPNRWMSFRKTKTLKNIHKFYFGDGFIIVKDVMYVDTLGVADDDEVLINSNEILKANQQNKISLFHGTADYIDNIGKTLNDLIDNYDDEQYEFIKKIINEQFLSEIKIVKKFDLKTDLKLNFGLAGNITLKINNKKYIIVDVNRKLKYFSSNGLNYGNATKTVYNLDFRINLIEKLTGLKYNGRGNLTLDKKPTLKLIKQIITENLQR